MRFIWQMQAYDEYRGLMDDLSKADQFTYQAWESLFVFVRPSVVCLSVCNVRAPYSGDCNFRQCFYAIWYLGHLLTSR